MTTGGKTYYYLADAQGSTTALADSTGHTAATYTYTPTGTKRTTTGTVNNPLQYTGAYLDPTGTYHLGERTYDPTLDRFTQTDPTGQETNPYAYAGEDPINNSDPSGQDWQDYALGCGKGAAQGLAVGGITGVDETGAGALGAATLGCGEGLVSQGFTDLFGDDVGQAADAAEDGYDLGDMVTAVFDI